MDAEFSTLSFSDIVSHCRAESTRYFQKKLVDTRYCLELFRRALFEQAEEAWDALYTQYRPLIVNWLNKGNRLAHIDEPVDALVDETFTRFWRNVTPDKFASFARLNSLLKYLELCAGSTILDCLRRYKQNVEYELDEPLFGADDPHDRLDHMELLEQIEQRLKDDDERLVFFAMYTLAMKPREIFEEWADRFESVRRVNQVRQNIVERLQRDEALQKYYAM